MVKKHAPPAPTGLRCRPVADDDLPGVAALLARAFPARGAAYWTAALATLRRRAVPEGYPRYGFLLEAEARPVGVVLMICQAIAHDGPPGVRCNLTSWTVEPAFRSHAALLGRMPLRYREATLTNTSPAPNTRATIEAQGFVRFAAGQVFALPWLARSGGGVRVEPFRAEDPAHAALPEAGLLADHRAGGCLVLVGRGPEGPTPFVLLPLRARQGRWPVPGAQLVFCRTLAEVVRFARPLGMALLARGRPILVVDGDGPVAGLPGHYRAGRAPKYARGPHPPRPGDLAYTEFALFGA